MGTRRGFDQNKEEGIWKIGGQAANFGAETGNKGVRMERGSRGKRWEGIAPPLKRGLEGKWWEAERGCGGRREEMLSRRGGDTRASPGGGV